MERKTKTLKAFTIQNGAYGWCGPDVPFSGFYPPIGFKSASLPSLACLDSNQVGNNWNYTTWDDDAGQLLSERTSYLSCKKDSDCEVGMATPTPHNISCQPMWWETPAGSQDCGSICVYPNISSTLPPDNIQPNASLQPLVGHFLNAFLITCHRKLPLLVLSLAM